MVLTSAGLEPEIAHRSRNYETVRAMVAHGHGFSVLNQRPRHDLTYDGRRVAARRIADDVPALRVVIATLPGPATADPGRLALAATTAGPVLVSPGRAGTLVDRYGRLGPVATALAWADGARTVII